MKWQLPYFLVCKSWFLSNIFLGASCTTMQLTVKYRGCARPTFSENWVNLDLDLQNSQVCEMLIVGALTKWALPQYFTVYAGFFKKCFTVQLHFFMRCTASFVEHRNDVAIGGVAPSKRHCCRHTLLHFS
uniref:Putative secreted protein n=1 Tax=Ixodes ricinus TaxID=34613 RepID=A0A6B0UQY3_IXORI